MKRNIEVLKYKMIGLLPQHMYIINDFYEYLNEEMLKFEDDPCYGIYLVQQNVLFKRYLNTNMKRTLNEFKNLCKLHIIKMNRVMKKRDTSIEEKINNKMK